MTLELLPTAYHLLPTTHHSLLTASSEQRLGRDRVSAGGQARGAARLHLQGLPAALHAPARAQHALIAYAVDHRPRHRAVQGRAGTPRAPLRAATSLQPALQPACNKLGVTLQPVCNPYGVTPGAGAPRPPAARLPLPRRRLRSMGHARLNQPPRWYPLTAPRRQREQRRAARAKAEAMA